MHELVHVASKASVARLVVTTTAGPIDTLDRSPHRLDEVSFVLHYGHEASAARHRIVQHYWRNGGFPIGGPADNLVTGGPAGRLSGSVAHVSRCPASPRRALLAENLGKPSLWVIITAPWY